MILLGVAGAVALAVGLWYTSTRLVAVTREPVGIMSTSVRLTAVVHPHQMNLAQRALDAAEAQLRAVEAHMSAHLDSSELSRFNAAPAGEEVPLSPDLMIVLRKSRQYAIDTHGAFDVTVKPLMDLWKQAGQEKRRPSDDEIRQVLALVGWQNVQLTSTGAIKLKDGVGIDLGGVAKKYAIDRAAVAMLQAGVAGGMIDVGGDIRCLGTPTRGGWLIDIRNPFDSHASMGLLKLGPRSVCTSGNYERFVEIDGQRYSHIKDPRTGMPADLVPSVTVVSDEAIAGIWATGLSVLGAEGLAMLPPGVDAMVVTGTPEDYQVHMTPGMKEILIALQK